MALIAKHLAILVGVRAAFDQRYYVVALSGRSDKSSGPTHHTEWRLAQQTFSSRL
jgi:hypothetical protein